MHDPRFIQTHLEESPSPIPRETCHRPHEKNSPTAAVAATAARNRTGMTGTGNQVGSWAASRSMTRSTLAEVTAGQMNPAPPPGHARFIMAMPWVAEAEVQ